MSIRAIIRVRLGRLGKFVACAGSGLAVGLVLASPLPAQDLDEELLRDLPATRPMPVPMPVPVPTPVKPVRPISPETPLSPVTPEVPDTSPQRNTSSKRGAPSVPGKAGSPDAESAPTSPGVLPSRPAMDLPGDLEGEDVGETPVESLHRAQGRMTEAARRLGAGDASTATRGLQSDALAALDTVITYEAERRRRGGAGRRSGASGKSGKDGKGGQQTAGGMPPGDRTGEDRSGGKPDASSGEPRSEGSGQGGQEGQEGAAGGTAGGTGEGEGKRTREPMESRAAVMETEAWGQLPPQLRERLRNSLPERFLPGFESLLEAYYRRLAESPRGRAEERP
jgi:hypothetical protein